MLTVGVSMRVVESFPHKEMRDAISHDWLNFLGKLGLTPVLIPNTPFGVNLGFNDVGVDAFLLTGGNNVGSVGVTDEFQDQGDVSELRDKTEFQIIERAVKDRIPLLGVCRGMQIINVFFGGTIVRDTTNLCGGADMHVANSHELSIVDPDFSDYFGRKRILTNSFHNHAVHISTVSSELEPFAVTEDGIVEGLFHPDLPILGVQWHPERAGFDTATDELLIKRWLSAV